jgi:hypothetical protein
MHGPDFLRATGGKFRCCDCDMDLCKAAGYFPNQDAMTVPVERQKFLLEHNNPKLFDDTKIELLESNKHPYTQVVTVPQMPLTGDLVAHFTVM